MQEEKRRFQPPAVGGSSLLVIFAVLCLTIFALLSLSTVQADERLGNAAAEAVTGYYEADTQAEGILARLRAGEMPPEVQAVGTDPMTVSYSCPIADTQALEVEIAFDGGLGDAYRILRWQAVSTLSWEADDSLHVWDGEFSDEGDAGLGVWDGELPVDDGGSLDVWDGELSTEDDGSLDVWDGELPTEDE